MHLRVPSNEKYRHLLIALLIFLASMLPASVSAQDVDKNIALDATLTSHLASIATTAVSEQLNTLTATEVSSSSVDDSLYLDAPCSAVLLGKVPCATGAPQVTPSALM